MAVSSDGIVYTGGKNDLGVISADQAGRIRFSSLLGMVRDSAKKFDRITNVVSDDRGHVFFMDKTWLLMWDGKEMHSWKSKIAFRRVQFSGGKIYIQSKDDGLWIFSGGNIIPVPGSEIVNNLNIKGIHINGAGHDTLLLVTYNQGIYKYSGKQVKHVPSSADSLVIWNTRELVNDQVAMTTEENGLAIFNKTNLRSELITEKQGLYFNSVTYPNIDAENGTWVASDIGVSRIDYPASLRSIVTPGKSKTMVLAMVLKKKQLVTGMVDGSWIYDPRKPQPVFEKIPGMIDVSRALILFEEQLLLGTPQHGIAVLDDGKQLEIFSGPVTALYRSAQNANKVWVGTETGLTSITWNGTTWQQEKPIEGIKHPVYDIAELPDGTVWAGFTSMSRVTFNKNTPGKPAVTTFDSARGFTPDHGDYDLFVHEGKLYFGTGRGIFRFDESKQKLVADAAFGERFADRGNGAHAMVHDLQGNIWLYDSKRTGVLRKDAQGKWQWDDLPLRRMEDQVVWSIYPAPDSLIWIGTNTTLYCYDPRIPKNYHVPFNALVDQVTVNDSDVVFYGNYAGADGFLTLKQPGSYKPTLLWEQNKISFSFTATSYEYPEKTVYSYWLEGLDAGWSQWTSETNKNFNNLREGVYTFHVRAKNLYDTVSEEAAYTFTILPPWYRTWWAYLLWGAAGAGLLLLLIRWQVKRANRKKDAERDAERKQQHIRLEATVDAQEKERSRIAKDLHDDIQVTLASAKMKMNMVRNQLKNQGLDASLTEEPVELVQDAIDSVRNISKDLMPVTLERLGLVTALRELFNKTGSDETLQTYVDVSGTEFRMAFSNELAVYRVCQELLANSLKHAAATAIRVALHFEAGALAVTYSDNGNGFDTTHKQQNSNGLGFRNMESRISLAGGTFSYASAPGQGCRFEFTVPAKSS